MGLLATGWGAGGAPVDERGWERLRSELEPFGARREWPSREEIERATSCAAWPRLGVFGAGGSLRWARDSGTGTRVAVGVGWLDDGQDVAGGALDEYRRAGAAGFGRLAGEYAFVVWDGHERSIYVGCDAIGRHAPA